MRIATWNVNSIRARLARVLDWLDREQPEVLCLQEIKCTEDVFPREAFAERGYELAIHGQPTYNAVAIASRLPLLDVQILSLRMDIPQARVIGATIGDVLV